MQTLKRILLGIALAAGVSTTILAQSQPSASRLICFDRIFWLVNKEYAARMGSCSHRRHAAVVHLGNPSTLRANRRLGPAVQFLEQSTPKEFAPELLNSLWFSKDLLQTKVSGQVVLEASRLPEHIREFIEPTMEFQLTQGVFVGQEYIETLRFSIRVKANNPTIGVILDEARKKLPDKKQLARYGEFFALQRFDTKEWLDEKKTVADYGLKVGDILILSVDSKKMGIPQGIR